ncbi:uncharacterized protein LOC129591122 [Paramacrobiotus metropolitanus]|uniref:uncharacterized protein LOC129591122 n=1 Tax=Paramacrobiotus metropolitanus TaxID=2943436 RepID=UPI0024462136|nr:uncharacterized protein LOC129591122 [Paramacrobiotus metropolitanus]
MRRYRSLLALFLLGVFVEVYTYYAHNRCFGSGDCIITTGYLGGGFADDYQKWLIECADGEAMIGIFDLYKQFLGINQVWCFFMFPMKPPSNGLYPYYPSCNVRNLTLREYYCYDKFFPMDTVDTFVTGYYGASSADPMQVTLQKCCKTPPGYKIDYTRCQWKYTHDKAGEHYDGYWVVKCDTHYVMTGTGQATNPWDSQLHIVWIQCCPVVTVPTAQNQLYLPQASPEYRPGMDRYRTYG